jgi:flagellar basal body rod protein FlgB
MRKKFRVILAKQVFDSMMKNNVLHPRALSNACLLLGISKHMGMKNEFMLYFMLKEKQDTYHRNIEPTLLEKSHMEYIQTNMHEDLSDYILAMQINVENDKTFDKSQLLDALFSVDTVETADTTGSAADTSAEQSHSEYAVYNSIEELEADKASTTATFEYSTVSQDGNSHDGNTQDIELQDDELSPIQMQYLKDISELEKQLESCTDSNEKRSLSMRLRNLRKKV